MSSLKRLRARVEHQEPRYVLAHLRVHRWKMEQERKEMQDEMRLIKKLIPIYEHKPTTHRIQHPWQGSPTRREQIKPTCVTGQSTA